MDPENCDVAVGIDGGQEILNVGDTIVQRESKENKERVHYEDVVVSKRILNSSVKKLVLLGVIPNVPENYSTVKQVLDNLDIQAVECVTSSDIKMLLTLTGKSNGGPKHGCPFCNGW